MGKRISNPVLSATVILVLCAGSAQAQITKVPNNDGRMLFVNADPPRPMRLPRSNPFAIAAKPTLANAAVRRPTSIYLPAETSLLGRKRPALDLDRDGAEKLVREAAERHSVDPALVRAVIETESNWNAAAVSRKGAVGLMQLIPTTAQRFGVNDLFSPQQNVDAGVRYLKTLLERYNGNLELALAAYNAGEGAVDRAHGIPHFRETRDYVERVQSAYFRPGSGRLDGLYINRHAIRKETDAAGRIIFTND